MTVKKRQLQALLSRRGRLGDFSKWIFPVIRNIPTLPRLEDVFRVQPYADYQRQTAEGTRR